MILRFCKETNIDTEHLGHPTTFDSLLSDEEFAESYLKMGILNKTWRYITFSLNCGMIYKQNVM